MNVNYLYDDIAHVLQNTIFLCINSDVIMCSNADLPNSVIELTSYFVPFLSYG